MLLFCTDAHLIVTAPWETPDEQGLPMCHATIPTPAAGLAPWSLLPILGELLEGPGDFQETYYPGSSKEESTGTEHQGRGP